MSLPIRILAEPAVRAKFGKSSFILPTTQEDKYCFVITEDGISAIIVESDCEMEEISNSLGLTKSTMPALIFIAKSKTWKTGPFHDKPLSQLSKTSADIVISGIERYYSRQVLEPSIRGFLSILEKQFTRNDLYLFELLQNAVDDAAMHVRFSVHQQAASSKGGLMFMHNGRQFTPLDVLGLSSVGLSTKGASEKRTIGFMGVGFKSVFKRYGRVTIYDDTFLFRFQQPEITPQLEPSNSWVLKPKLLDQSAQERLWDTSVDSQCWCHFQLESPVGGIDSVFQDIGDLAVTIPPLLGRQALANASKRGDTQAQWTLEWNGITHSVQLKPRVSISSAPSYCTSDEIDVFVSGQSVMRLQTGSSSKPITSRGRSSLSTSTSTPASTSTWQFLSVRFVPDATAKQAYEVHTKRPWVGSVGLTPAECSDTAEETSIFFKVSNSTGAARSSSRKGVAHAVLPTKLALPTAVNWQASWLLSVDRQDVQNVFDNAWNNCILLQAPKLFVNLLHWAASTPQAENLQAAYSLLPPCCITKAVISPGDWIKVTDMYVLTATIFQQSISMEALVTEIRTAALVPVLTAAAAAERPKNAALKLGTTKVIDLSESPQEVKSSPSASYTTSRSTRITGSSSTETPPLQIQFRKSSCVIWLPPPLVARIPADLLKLWLGADPFASSVLQESAWLALWKCLPRPTDELLVRRKHSFLLPSSGMSFDGEDTVSVAIRILAGLSECMGLDWPAQGGEAGGAGSGSGGADGGRAVSSMGSSHQPGRNHWKSGGGGGGHTNKHSAITIESIEPDLICGDYLPAARKWPVFLCQRAGAGTGAGAGAELRPASELYWVHPDEFAALTDDLRALLRLGVAPLPHSSSPFTPSKSRMHSSKTTTTAASTKSGRDLLPLQEMLLPILDESLEQVVLFECADDSTLSGKMTASNKQATGWMDLDARTVTAARQCILTMHSIFPQRVVGVDAAAQNILRYYFSLSSNVHLSTSSTEVQHILAIFQWAFRAGRPQAVSHILVDTGTNGSEEMKLLPSSTAYLGSVYSAAEGGELETLMKSSSGSGSGELAALAVSSKTSGGSHIGDRKSHKVYALPPPAVAVAPAPTSSSSASTVSSCYLQAVVSGASSAGSSTQAKLRLTKQVAAFLTQCGVQTGVALEAFSRALFPNEMDKLPGGTMPKLRSSNTSFPLQLPFGLENLTRKDVRVVDVDLTPEWKTIVKSLSLTNAVDRSAEFASHVSDLFANGDFTASASPESTPCAAAILRGKPLTDPAEIRAVANLGFVYRSDSKRIPSGSPCPLVARAFYLPPGQPGASAVSVGPAAWVKWLADQKWVPAAPAGAALSSPPSIVLSPREVVLLSSPTKSHLHTRGTGGSSVIVSPDVHLHMPTARLPPEVLQVFLSAPAVVSEVLAWGTVRPPPPIDLLETLAKRVAEAEAEKKEAIRAVRTAATTATPFSISTTTGDEATEDGSVPGVSLAADIATGVRAGVGAKAPYYDELVYTWRALAVAHREKRLTRSDITRILNLCTENRGRSRLIPISNSRTIAFNRVVDASPSALSSASISSPPAIDNGVRVKKETKHVDSGSMAVKHFVASNFLFDLSGTFGVGSNRAAEKVKLRGGTDAASASVASKAADNGSSTSGSLSLSSTHWPLQEDAALLVDILQPPTAVTPQQARDFLMWCSSGVPTNITSSLRAAYSAALWITLESYTMAELPHISVHTPLTSAIISTARAKLQQSVPTLKVYCARGPGTGPRAFPARWVDCFEAAVCGTVGKSEKLPGPRPVLVDDIATRAGSLKSEGGEDKEGLLCSSYLRPDHLLQPLAMLTHGCGGTGSEDDTLPHVDLEHLSRIDCQLISVLGIDRTSDRRKFSVTVRSQAPYQESESATLRLNIVVDLLAVLRPHELSSSFSVPTTLCAHSRRPRFVKCSSLTVELRFPTTKNEIESILIFAARENYCTTTSLSSFSSVGSVASTGKVDSSDCYSDRRSSIGSKRKMEHCIIEGGEEGHMVEEEGERVFVAGDADDYGSELEAVVLEMLFGPRYSAVFGSSSGSGSDRSNASGSVGAGVGHMATSELNKALRLLSFLEDGAKFRKHMSRSFESYIGDTEFRDTQAASALRRGWEKHEEVFRAQEEQERERERERLRVQAAEEARLAVEAEAKVKLEAVARLEAQVRLPPGSSRHKQQHQQQQQQQQHGAENHDRDRNQYERDLRDDANSDPSGAAKELAEQFLARQTRLLAAAAVAAPSAGGDGGLAGGAGPGPRGVSNLPAWMTAGGGAGASTSSLTAEEAARLWAEPNRLVDHNVGDGNYAERFNGSSYGRASSPPIADWEAHTRGIGSRLLEKFGYVKGGGLGKDEEGVAEIPTEALDGQLGSKGLGYVPPPKQKNNSKNKKKGNRAILQEAMKEQQRRDEQESGRGRTVDYYSGHNVDSSSTSYLSVDVDAHAHPGWSDAGRDKLDKGRQAGWEDMAPHSGAGSMGTAVTAASAGPATGVRSAPRGISNLPAWMTSGLRQALCPVSFPVKEENDVLETKHVDTTADTDTDIHTERKRKVRFESYPTQAEKATRAGERLMFVTGDLIEQEQARKRNRTHEGDDCSKESIDKHDDNGNIKEDGEVDDGEDEEEDDDLAREDTVAVRQLLTFMMETGIKSSLKMSRDHSSPTATHSDNSRAYPPEYLPNDSTQTNATDNDCHSSCSNSIVDHSSSSSSSRVDHSSSSSASSGAAVGPEFIDILTRIVGVLAGCHGAVPRLVGALLTDAELGRGVRTLVTSMPAEQREQYRGLTEILSTADCATESSAAVLVDSEIVVESVGDC